MVPVMAGGIVLGGKSYGFFEYLQVSGSRGGGGGSSSSSRTSTSHVTLAPVTMALVTTGASPPNPNPRVRRLTLPLPCTGGHHHGGSGRLQPWQEYEQEGR
eukprot:scaffold17629_cov38-Phaeocystis_antarctica.AAC.2